MNAIASNDDSKTPDNSLRERLRSCQEEGLPGIPVAELLSYIRDVGDVLDDLHEEKQTHRNVNPDTIQIVDGQATLADADMPHPPSRGGTLAGSPAYMAPETWAGAFGPASHQYSLACTYAEMRFGRAPFTGSGLMECMLAHRDSKPELSSLPAGERSALSRALDKDPARRYPNCRIMAEALERAAGVL